MATGPPLGKWKDGLCDCFSNLWPSFGCSFLFHSMWLQAQSMLIMFSFRLRLYPDTKRFVISYAVAQKTGYCSFSAVFISYLVIYLIALAISLVTGVPVFFFIVIILAWIFSIFLRFHVVSRYQIVSYGGFMECLVAFFCCSCSVCQSKLSCYFAHEMYLKITFGYKIFIRQNIHRRGSP